MRYWTWDELDAEILLQPKRLEALLALPHLSDMMSLDEWLALDDQKSESAAAVISCRCAESFKAQQRENMAYRRIVSRTVREWNEACRNDRGVLDPIRRIEERYEKERKCHRKFSGAAAEGVYCYCDEHDHEEEKG